MKKWPPSRSEMRGGRLEGDHKIPFLAKREVKPGSANKWRGLGNYSAVRTLLVNHQDQVQNTLKTTAKARKFSEFFDNCRKLENELKRAKEHRNSALKNSVFCKWKAAFSEGKSEDSLKESCKQYYFPLWKKHTKDRTLSKKRKRISALHYELHLLSQSYHSLLSYYIMSTDEASMLVNYHSKKILRKTFTSWATQIDPYRPVIEAYQLHTLGLKCFSSWKSLVFL